MKLKQGQQRKNHWRDGPTVLSPKALKEWDKIKRKRQDEGGDYNYMKEKNSASE